MPNAKQDTFHSLMYQETGDDQITGSTFVSQIPKEATGAHQSVYTDEDFFHSHVPQKSTIKPQSEANVATGRELMAKRNLNE